MQLLRDLPGFAQNVRELPFCCPYSVKARALLHAHFDRKKLPPKTLDQGDNSKWRLNTAIVDMWPFVQSVRFKINTVLVSDRI